MADASLDPAPNRLLVVGFLVVSLIALAAISVRLFTTLPSHGATVGPVYEVTFTGLAPAFESEAAEVPALVDGDAFRLLITRQQNTSPDFPAVAFALQRDGERSVWSPPFTTPRPGEVLIEGKVGVELAAAPGLVTLEVELDGVVRARQAVLLR